MLADRPVPGSSAVLFLGGNGHCRARLRRAQWVLEQECPPLRLVDVPYPGFEGRPCPGSLERFLDELERFTTEHESGASLAVATGIGGLIAFFLRARGGLRLPLILQAPVLWGLERRWLPRVLRWRGVRRLLPRVFASPRFQRRFVRRHFRRPVDDDLHEEFFRGYAECAALAPLFAWFTPAVLRDLERRFADRPEALGQVTVWWGGHDTVVDERDLRVTEQALGVHWPVKRFASWGHYPMIDVPEEWAAALRHAVAQTQR